MGAETALYLHTTDGKVFTLQVLFIRDSVINIHDTLPVLVSARGVCPLRF